MSGMVVNGGGGAQAAVLIKRAGPSSDLLVPVVSAPVPRPVGYQQLTSLATTKGLTVPAGARLAVIQNNSTSDVRYRDDGANPTSNIGQLLPAGAELHYDAELSALKLIEVSASAVLDIAYYA